MICTYLRVWYFLITLHILRNSRNLDGGFMVATILTHKEKLNGPSQKRPDGKHKRLRQVLRPQQQQDSEQRIDSLLQPVRSLKISPKTDYCC